MTAIDELVEAMRLFETGECSASEKCHQLAERLLALAELMGDEQ